MAFKLSHKKIQTSMAAERNAPEASNKSGISAPRNQADEQLILESIFRRVEEYAREASAAMHTTEPDRILIYTKNEVDRYSATAFTWENEREKIRGIIVGKGLMLEFTPEDLRAIISHEVSHLKHNDMERKDLLNALSRRRELRADREAAFVVGPHHMISALNKLKKFREEQMNELSKEKQRIELNKTEKLMEKGMNKVLEIISGNHPSFHKRIKRLERLARQIGDLS